MFQEFIAIVVSIMSIAGISIGIQCLNESKKSGSNKNFLIFLLVANILSFIGACIKLYLGR